MWSLKSLRIVCSPRALTLLHPNWSMASRQSVYKAAVTFSAQFMLSTGFSTKDTWHNNTNFKTLGKEEKLISCTNPVSLPRNYCTGQVKLNCWNCKQRLDKTPVFFCMSCKVIQPPEEGASYFKIMDWWVSGLMCLYSLSRYLFKSLCDQNISCYHVLPLFSDYTFTLDTQKLQKRYLQLQRSLHPDNFSQRSVVGRGM